MNSKQSKRRGSSDSRMPLTESQLVAEKIRESEGSEDSFEIIDSDMKKRIDSELDPKQAEEVITSPKVVIY